MSSSDLVAPALERAACPTCKAVFRGTFRRCPNDGALLEPGADDPLVGGVLAERYLIEAIIGDGGLARVYRARHVRMSRRFAIKVPFGEVGYDRKARARMGNEAEAASRLDHPNVIGVVDVGETTEGLFYLAMDLAEGQSLASVVAREPLTQARALGLFAQLAAGLAHAHERGLIHRDLKPDNIIVSIADDGSELVQIIDFGLALLDIDEHRSRLTTQGLVMGTPHYMAPEQATDEELDFRTDLFALGIILFEMLAGVLPFDGGPTEVARQNVAATMPSIRDRSGRGVDPVVEALIGWLTRKVAAERPDRTAHVLAIARALAAGDMPGARALLPPAFRPLATAEVLAPEPSAPVMIAPPAVVPARGAGRMVAIGAGVAAIAIAALVIARCGGDGAPAVAVAAPDANTPRLVSIDAASVAVAEVEAGPPIDAGIDDAAIAIASIDARPRRAPDVIVDARPRAEPAVTRPDAAIRTAPDARPPGPVPPGPIGEGPDTSGMSLKALYSSVATALARATDLKGADAVAPLRRRFEAVPPYLEAARKPALRTEAEQQLRALVRDLARLTH
ncbi:MAG: serine/threonine protein kinase [Deltaproteobacteria bacterium]|nr:serine/threonine protein kinase [Deltaproteobacteria bacterium]